jgi:hypothetical protein
MIQRQITDVADARWAPAPALCEALDTKPSYLGIWTTFLPSIHTASTQGAPFVCVEAPGDHAQQTLPDRIEDLVRVVSGAYPQIRAGGLLGREMPVLDCWHSEVAPSACTLSELKQALALLISMQLNRDTASHLDPENPDTSSSHDLNLNNPVF